MVNKIFSNLIGGIVGGSLFFSSCDDNYVGFENYQILKQYDELIQKDVYVLKRPDKFTCTIIEGQEEVLISKKKEENNFLRPKSAYAIATSGGAVIGIIGSGANSMRIAREKMEHKKKLESLTKEDRKRIDGECLGVLKRYVVSLGNTGKNN
jgi:hypothetical protein